MVTWDSEQYLRFKRERTQPARDLAMQLPPDDGSVTRVLDIGCGPGNSTAVLRERYPHAKILGVDSSPVMIETARKTYPDIDFQLCDVSGRLRRGLLQCLHPMGAGPSASDSRTARPAQGRGSAGCADADEL